MSRQQPGATKSYRDLDIYCISYDLALRVHNLSLRLPQYELFEEGSQVRRSSKGVTACIVEGYGRKRYKGDLVRYLVCANASCDETILHLKFIRDTHAEHSREAGDLSEAYAALAGKIHRFTQYVDRQWKTSPLVDTKPVNL